MAEADSLTGRQFLIRLFLRAAAALAIAVLAAYAVDALVLQYRISTNHNPFGDVTVHPYYAVPRKDQKTELMFDNPRDETCVNSLFPHSGNTPCWYLRRHPDERIDM